MAIITLTTDFGSNDFLVASLKGQILKSNPNIQLIDITHGIDSFNIAEAAYVVKNAYHHFPQGTIHIIGVDALPHHSFIVAEIDGHFFITSNNGLLSLICDEKKPDKIIIIKKENEKTEFIFPTRDFFIPTALRIIAGESLLALGIETDEIKKIYTLQPTLKGNTLTGTIVYIDHFGNVVSNIERKKFNEMANGRKYNVFVRGHSFEKIYTSYSDIIKDPENEVQYHGKGMVLFNSAQYLEVAVYKSKPESFGSAQSLYRLNYGDNILIEFIDE